MASFPSAVKVFASRSDGQVINASHVGDLQDEVSAIEDGLINGTAPLNSSAVTAARLNVSGNSTFTGSAVFSSNVTVTLALTAGSVTSTGSIQTSSNVNSSGQITAPNQPAWHLFSSVVITGAAGSTASVPFEQELIDQGGFHSTASSAATIVVPAGSSGLYAISMQTVFLTTGVVAGLYVTQNTTRVVGIQASMSQFGLTHQLNTILRLDGGDVIRMELVGPGGSTWSAGSASLPALSHRCWGAKLS